MFTNDYSVLAHKRIMDALNRYANEENIAYGNDYHSLNAKKYISDLFNIDNADIHFLTGGTQTNMVLISYALRPYEGVISVSSGHINVHETAAVEGSGHKIYTVDGVNGKITKDAIEKALLLNPNEHTVKLKMVYISNSTEIGTIYSKNELKEIYECCKKNGLYLFIDGARIGSALTSKDNDLSPSDLKDYSDAFYIGGTKCGLMFGEALVIVNDELKKDFRYHIKNKGAMLAKGYALGIQFEEAFKDELYFELASHSNEMASFIQENLINLGFKLNYSPTNQLFVTLKREHALDAIKRYGLELWNDFNDFIEVRIVTRFNTSLEDAKELVDYFKENYR